ncbi:4'-phosphopantetheinyl transferase superfamily protein [Clostridium sp. YIM B02505]|uniref:4'-phosphopantetheinyl transferase superfamily protein n=1 Tax=Clostridium yunnanense TaxID=2800325 RepID=A0ABS1EPS6_9CLOT|nr:4'-phosphopantetheinyl transferase superfamily protein [Clostridium yunnanense]MBK1811288.1 4'-phosphopantetheinyl transferase superfamily protein [Clostridium yunnanense]
MNKLYFLPIAKQVEQPQFNKLLFFISHQKQVQIKRYHLDIDKKLSLYSDLLVRITACQALDMKNSDIVFEKGDHGKPYINQYVNFNYNISHTRDAIVLAISDSAIGVDIEKIRKADPYIAKRFFTSDEQEYIIQDNFQSDRRFCEVWTKKEAYVKYSGKGLSMPLNYFNVLSCEIYDKMLTFEKDGYIISVYNNKRNQKFELIELVEREVEIAAFSLLL